MFKKWNLREKKFNHLSHPGAPKEKKFKKSQQNQVKMLGKTS